ncbi:hypothetical protein GW17_00020285 [Ensete ventricosum]|nr:hypothetical protein GW17_00020285 [Ensete ventricosum]
MTEKKPQRGFMGRISFGDRKEKKREREASATYDVSAFLSHRMFDTGDPVILAFEVRVRFSGFGVEEDEWINVRRCVRQRSLPCEAAECVAVLPGDLILCFQVLRPETDYRLQMLQASKVSGGPVDLQATPRDLTPSSSSKDLGSQRSRKQRKLMDVNTDEVTTVALSHPNDPASLQGDNPAVAIENSSSTPSNVMMEDGAVNMESIDS